MNKKPLILIVDDTLKNIQVLGSILLEHEYDIHVARDGQQALDAIDTINPDLILLDVIMPILDGFETCRRLKANAKTKHIPVIFLTAKTTDEDMLKGFELGGIDYVTKPFSSVVLLARVNTQIKLYQLQKKMQEYTIELEQRNQQLDAFSRTVAHDLKNPLNTVIGYSDELAEICIQDNLLDDELRLQLNLVAKAGHKMEDIITSLLLFAKTSKDDVIDKQPLNMSNIIKQVQERLIYAINGCNAEITIPDNFPTVISYGPWVEEIWANYISNGLKYGGYPPKLELGADIIEDDNMVRFWIKDNGQGLSTEAQAKLFIPFTRLHTNAQAEGHGLGLSIIQQIAERLNGKVGVESEVGQGSTFYFSLPFE
ncbi:response regulator [Candidatus Halobeggiatoa sp. HSG11]|nr:response regulator [Candidatus Halobeggiatoa sp. HSG11]